MSLQRPPRYTASPPTPDDHPLMRAILNAAQQMFAGDPWEDVEPHLRRAWRTVPDATPWEDVRDWMQASWLKLNSDAAANGRGNPLAAGFRERANGIAGAPAPGCPH